MTIELDEYGFVFDTYIAYIALSWQVLIPVTIAIIAFKFYKRKNKKK